MTQKRLNGLAILCIEKKLLYKIDLNGIINDFIYGWMGPLYQISPQAPKKSGTALTSFSRFQLVSPSEVEQASLPGPKLCPVRQSRNCCSKQTSVLGFSAFPCAGGRFRSRRPWFGSEAAAAAACWCQISELYEDRHSPAPLLLPPLLLGCLPLLVLCDLVTCPPPDPPFPVLSPPPPLASPFFLPWFPEQSPNKSMSSSSLSLSPSARTSGSDGDSAADTRRREKRRLSNRESARRSRLRKQQHLDELAQEAALLQAENARVAARAADVASQHARVEQENAVLRARAAELGARLRSVNEVLRVVQEFSGVAMDIQEEMPADDPLLRPWQLPCYPAAAMPIGAPHMLHY